MGNFFTFSELASFFEVFFYFTLKDNEFSRVLKYFKKRQWNRCWQEFSKQNFRDVWYFLKNPLCMIWNIFLVVFTIFQYLLRKSSLFMRAIDKSVKNIWYWHFKKYQLVICWDFKKYQCMEKMLNFYVDIFKNNNGIDIWQEFLKYSFRKVWFFLENISNMKRDSCGVDNIFQNFLSKSFFMGVFYTFVKNISPHVNRLFSICQDTIFRVTDI